MSEICRSLNLKESTLNQPLNVTRCVSVTTPIHVNKLLYIFLAEHNNKCSVIAIVLYGTTSVYQPRVEPLMQFQCQLSTKCKNAKLIRSCPPPPLSPHSFRLVVYGNDSVFCVILFLLLCLVTKQ